MDNFDLLTDNGRLLTEDGEFGQLQFRDMMRGELWRYSRRELVNVLAFSGEAPVVLQAGAYETPPSLNAGPGGCERHLCYSVAHEAFLLLRERVRVLVLADSEEFKSTVVMLKIMDTKLAQAIRDSEHRVTDKIDKLLGALGLGAGGAGVDGGGQEGRGEEDSGGGGGGMDSGQEGREGKDGKNAGGLEVQVLKMMKEMKEELLAEQRAASAVWGLWNADTFICVIYMNI